MRFAGMVSKLLLGEIQELGVVRTVAVRGDGFKGIVRILKQVDNL